MKKLLTIAAAAAATATVALSAAPADAHAAPLRVDRFASANPGSVNSYAVRDGLLAHGQDGCVCHTHGGSGSFKAGL